MSDPVDRRPTKRTLDRPSGSLPPVRTTLSDGTELDLVALAAEVSNRFFEQHPEDLGRYPEGVAHAWCTHDNQHLIHWAAKDASGLQMFHRQLDWLSNVLSSRGYPLAHLADGLDIAADVVPHEGTTSHLRAGAVRIRAGLAQPHG
ncbi:MAG: hypothetical protein JWM86_2858 [Thermoleophilia bacterium]|nr:hypothetical protein [Thermoleophilia bacterium]